MLARIATTTAALALGLTAAAGAGDAYDVKPLTVGDPAPAIDVTYWLKGAEVPEFEAGNVYVLEFWATWCGPCRASMPHLTEVQERFRDYDVTVIGVSDEKLQTVVEFLTREDKEGTLWTEKTQYTLAADPDRSVYTDYMYPSGNSGIPTSFIIGKDGRIEWIGHPQMGLDDALDAVVRDGWDRAAYRAEWEEKIAAQREKLMPYARLEKAKQAGDWAVVVESLDGMIEKNPKDMRMQMQKFTLLLKELNRPDEAYRAGHQMLEAGWDEAGFLNAVAWTVVDDPAVKTRDLDFALKAAMRANELQDGEDAAVLDTVARIHFEMGHLEKAIAWQEKAVAAAGEGEMAEQIREVLEKYRQQK